MKTFSWCVYAAPLALMLAPGCHVFSTLSIDCTAGMPCAAQSDADTDADTDADADADTDADTDTDPSEPTQGYAIAYVAGSLGKAEVYNADGTERRNWHDYPAISGPIAYDAATDTCTILEGGEGLVLYSDGTQSGGATGTSQIFDADAYGGQLWMDFGTDVMVLALDGSSQTSVFNGSLTNARGIAVQRGAAYVVDDNTGGPDLYACSAPDSCTLLYQDFDTTAARGRNVFFGPDGEPYGCTGAGAVYAIRDLAAGNTSTTAFYTGDVLTDVSDCAWDPGSEEFLLFSPSLGVIRMGLDSVGDVVTPIPSGTTASRAHFFSE